MLSCQMGLGEAKRELVFHRGAVSILTVTPENKLVIVKQYRKAIEKISYEIPAEQLEIGENGSEKKVALRELEEETGYTGDLELIHEFYTAIGFCNEKNKTLFGDKFEESSQPTSAR